MSRRQAAIGRTYTARICIGRIYRAAPRGRKRALLAPVRCSPLLSCSRWSQAPPWC